MDVIFANPPFGTEIIIDDPRVLAQYEVASAFDEANGTFVVRRNADEKPVLQGSLPPEVLFVERCLQFLKPGGRMAIVLPNGLLNNPGLTYFRSRVLGQAQLLAVVDMHRDLFQPKNDTQTSMVLFRKWGVGESAESHGDYPIFMAVAEKVGHDKRGKATYKRAADGSVLLRDVTTKHDVLGTGGNTEKVVVTAREPILDDELDDVAEAYHIWLNKKITRTAPKASL